MCQCSNWDLNQLCFLHGDYTDDVIEKIALVDTLPALFHFFLYVRKVILGVKLAIEKEEVEQRANPNYPKTEQTTSNAIMNKLSVLPNSHLYSRKAVIKMAIKLQIVSPKHICSLCYEGPFETYTRFKQHGRDEHNIPMF